MVGPILSHTSWACLVVASTIENQLGSAVIKHGQACLPTSINHGAWSDQYPSTPAGLPHKEHGGSGCYHDYHARTWLWWYPFTIPWHTKQGAWSGPVRIHQLVKSYTSYIYQLNTNKVLILNLERSILGPSILERPIFVSSKMSNPRRTYCILDRPILER